MSEDDAHVAQGTTALLAVIGIGPDAERLYGMLLNGHPADEERIAAETGMAAERIAAALRELEEHHLIERSQGQRQSWVAVDPAVALEVLLLAREQQIKKARIQAHEFAERYRVTASSRDPGMLIEIVRGRRECLDRAQQLQRAARGEIKVLDRPPYGHDPAIFNEAEFDLLRRGGSAMVIYDLAAIGMPGRLSDLEASIALGEQARVLPELPTKLFIIDDSTAMLPPQAAPQVIESIVVVHKSGLLEAMIALFGRLWDIAEPLPLDAAPVTAAQPADQPGAQERRLLRLLAAGVPDDVIARELGLSARTYQRRLRLLMDGIGARTRFQLALKAVGRGWLAAAPVSAAPAGSQAPA